MDVKLFCVILLSLFLAGDGFYVYIHLRAPRYVKVDGSATLHCDYDITEDGIHKVEFLRGDQKILQFVNRRKPPYRNYTIQGAELDLSVSDREKIVLRNMQFEASGYYTCEITLLNPIYSKPSQEEYISVIQTQTEDPHITFNKANFTVGDKLDVNCTSGRAVPAPELTWIVNGALANDSFIRSFPEQVQSSSMVQLAMPVMESHYPMLTLTCLSTIPGYIGHHASYEEYADYRSQTITLNVSLPPTEYAQIVNGAQSSSRVAIRRQSTVLCFLLSLIAYFEL